MSLFIEIFLTYPQSENPSKYKISTNMSVRLPPVSCQYLEMMEQSKKYSSHTRRVASARACVDSRPKPMKHFSFYLDRYRDKDKATRLKQPRALKSARGPPKKLSPDDWMFRLDDCIMPPPKGTKVSPSAILLFPSPVIPNTRTPETLRQIIDDSGLHVLDESPLSARDAYYAKDIQSMTIKPPGPAFNVKPSPRPKSMRDPGRTNSSKSNEVNSQNSKFGQRGDGAQSERLKKLRPSLNVEPPPPPREVTDEEQRRIFEEQKRKFDEFNLDDFDVSQFNVDSIE
ncbi:hypothetical protein TRFO_09168 [Tritrichomonas foetus]|uniref:Uncharacterized protein n=1 Tax=Tritrichomonas foetus TaxID=1144522 RepID=A0A1J4JFR9_9EUKA|nr:hypothetical protein TRFO_09168 [Tritrichomonas foetus]|eukprot:OHS97994.1 hypothetical protein TRFO_09168 [Tritrichomonas foetus]